MAGKWDSNLKRLVQANPQDFANLLLEGAIIKRELSVEVNREIYIDILYEVTIKDATEIIHIEFQRYEDEDMAWRVMGYNTFTTCKYKCPVHSFVIYLKKEGKVAESPLIVRGANGQEIWRFNFTNVKLWEIPTETLRQMNCASVLPLLALTREGSSREVVNEAIARIQQADISQEVKENLLTFTLHLATLGFRKQGDKDWLKERFFMLRDIIKDTEIYQIILQEGVEKERAGTCNVLQEIILSIMRTRFPELVEPTAERVKALTDLGSLQKLASGLGSASSVDQARTLLEALKTYDSH